MKRMIAILAIILALSGVTYGAIYLTRSQTFVEAVQQVQAPQPTPEPTHTSDMSVQALHESINAIRREAGLPELVLDDKLNQSAQLKVNELELEGWDDTPHTSNAGVSGTRYIFQTMPECPYGSENLRFVEPNISLRIVVDGWMKSQPHREAILSARWTRVGYAFTDSYTAQHFC